MTSSDHVRRRAPGRRSIRERPEAAPAVRGPSLPERLEAARERKGVDLNRAERDTKIRARYLSALERGEYRELPGAVYTKGFLRNYAVYLGLDPEDVLTQWRRERGEQSSPIPLIVPPRPIAEPPRPLTFSPSVIVAALMTLGVILFGVYLAAQLLRYAKAPDLAVTNPAQAVIEVDDVTTAYRLAGTSTPGSTIVITSPGVAQPYRATVAADGSWSVDVELRRGSNQFDVTATNPDTGKAAESPRTIRITVPFLAIQAPTLSISQPVEGTTYENGAIPVEGTTANASSVTVTAAWLGAAPGVARAPPSIAAPDATASAPTGLTVDVDENGAFSTPVELTEGQWAITVTATSAQGRTASLTRSVTVAYRGVNVVVTIQGSKAWIKAWVDGVIDPSVGAGGTVFSSGKTLTFSGKESVEVRTGSSGVTFFTLNGVSLGTLGDSGNPETWLFAPPAPPKQTERR